MAKLVYEDQGVVCEFVLDPAGAPCTIGRNPTCDVRVNDPSMSRRHAEVYFNQTVGDFEVRDLGSSNGTYVNGRPAASTPVSDNDEIICGEFRLRFLVEPANAVVIPDALAPEPSFSGGPVPTFIKNPVLAVPNRTQIGFVPSENDAGPETTTQSRGAAARFETPRAESAALSASAMPQPVHAPRAPSDSGLLAERDALSQQLSALKTEYQELRTRLATAVNPETFANLQRRAESLATERDQLITHQANLRADLEDYHSALTDRDATITTMQAGLDALHAANTELSEQMRAIQSARELVASRALVAEAEIQSLRAQFDGLRADVLRVAEINQQLHHEIDRVNTALVEFGAT